MMYPLLITLHDIQSQKILPTIPLPPVLTHIHSYALSSSFSSSSPSATGTAAPKKLEYPHCSGSISMYPLLSYMRSHPDTCSSSPCNIFYGEMCKKKEERKDSSKGRMKKNRKDKNSNNKSSI